MPPDGGVGWFINGKYAHPIPESVVRDLVAAGMAPSEAQRVVDLAIGCDGDPPRVKHSWVSTPQSTPLGVVEYRR